MTTATDAMAAALADPDTFVAGPPWELFATLRAQEPVAWSPEPLPHHGFWSVTRHADIVAVSRDVEGFTSTRGVSLEELDDNQLEHRTSMIDTDPPRHTARLYADLPVMLRPVIPQPMPRVAQCHHRAAGSSQAPQARRSAGQTGAVMDAINVGRTSQQVRTNYVEFSRAWQSPWKALQTID
jgi:cytochrome P450